MVLVLGFSFGCNILSLLKTQFIYSTTFLGGSLAHSNHIHAIRHWFDAMRHLMLAHEWGESVVETISDRGAIWDFFRNSFFVVSDVGVVAVTWRDFIEVIRRLTVAWEIVLWCYEGMEEKFILPNHLTGNSAAAKGAHNEEESCSTIC